MTRNLCFVSKEAFPCENKLSRGVSRARGKKLTSVIETWGSVL